MVSLGLLVTVSCRRYVFEFQPDSAIEGGINEITIDRPEESDILVVVDSSGSMKEEQENLARNFQQFIERLAASPNKFQIGITTTDLVECTDVAPSPNPWDGKCGRLLSPDGADPIMRRTDFADNAALVARFQATVGAVGTNGSGYEQGLKASQRAIDPELSGPGKPNAGFIRPNAFLVIIFLTDESDCSFSSDPQKGTSVFVQSALKAGESCYKLKDLLEAPESWASQVADVKRRASLVGVCTISSAIADPAGGNEPLPSECSVDPAGLPTNACTCFLNNPLEFCRYTSDQSQPPAQSTPNCTGPGCCSALGNDRYQSFANYFKFRFKDSICRSEYNETLFKCADIARRPCFPLTKGPAGKQEDYVRVERRLKDETKFTVLPQVPASVGFAGDGWFYYTERTTLGEDVHEVCLAGSYADRQLGDAFKIFVVSDTTGTDSDIAAQ